MKVDYEKIKRITDILVSVAILLILTPVWIIVALLIKADNPEGTVLFKQIRVGKNGRTFEMYKFRTMINGADNLKSELLTQNDQAGPIFKMKKDPRITRVGGILRKTSLDEFPQLFNVIKGEMSLIGPRPSLPSEAIQFSEYEHQRFIVKPGCTGLWQVSGRSNLNFNRMIQLDLEYINTYGVIIDIKIFIKTFKVLLFREGAY